jgi:hypothetical protein
MARVQRGTRTCELAELVRELERLHRKVARGGEDERADPLAGVPAAKALQHGYQECGGLPGPSARHGGDVVASEDERHGLALDRGGHAVPFELDPAVHLLAQPHRLEAARLGLLHAAARNGLGLLRPLQRLRLRRSIHGGRRRLGLPAGVRFGRGATHGWEKEAREVGGERRVGFRALLWSAAAARRWGRRRRRGGVNLGSEAIWAKWAGLN